MKWVDYREQLGIGFDDDEKSRMLSTVIQNYVQQVLEDSYSENSYLNYCQMIFQIDSISMYRISNGMEDINTYPLSSRIII